MPSVQTRRPPALPRNARVAASVRKMRTASITSSAASTFSIHVQTHDGALTTTRFPSSLRTVHLAPSAGVALAPVDASALVATAAKQRKDTTFLTRSSPREAMPHQRCATQIPRSQPSAAQDSMRRRDALRVNSDAVAQCAANAQITSIRSTRKQERVNSVQRTRQSLPQCLRYVGSFPPLRWLPLVLLPLFKVHLVVTSRAVLFGPLASRAGSSLLLRRKRKSDARQVASSSSLSRGITLCCSCSK